MVAMDALYKILHATRPYELEEGTSDALFEKYSRKLCRILEGLRVNITHLLSAKHLRPLEELLREAVDEFSQVPRSGGKRPLIIVNGEFYVRLDDRNREIIRKIEREGGEVSLAPASGFYLYCVY